MKEKKSNQANDILHGMWKATQVALMRIMMGSRRCTEILAMNMEPTWTEEQVLDYVDEVCFLLVLVDRVEKSKYMNRHKGPLMQHAWIAACEVERVLNMNAYIVTK